MAAFDIAVLYIVTWEKDLLLEITSVYYKD